YRQVTNSPIQSRTDNITGPGGCQFGRAMTMALANGNSSELMSHSSLGPVIPARKPLPLMA
ncbi:MAG: hypothetical protein OXN21_09590, partial [Chloroflexota bacterium]|nr:hypothetical protein [Chloroflexota bacterium]